VATVGIMVVINFAFIFTNNGIETWKSLKRFYYTRRIEAYKKSIAKKQAARAKLVAEHPVNQSERKLIEDAPALEEASAQPNSESKFIKASAKTREERQEARIQRRRAREKEDFEL
jgi:hypothetical protein